MFLQHRAFPVTLRGDAVLPWTIVGISVGTEVLSGDYTAGEAALTAPGDLLVECISYRSNAAFTLPAGWTIVATQQSSGNTTVNTTGSIASGLMAYIVRGASAPSFVFTRTGGDVARGATLTYRGNHTTPYDTGSANTLASASTACTTGTITTAQNNELLVAMTAAAMNTSISAFDAVTGATTDSVVDTNTDPLDNAWLQRRNAGSTNGADYLLAIADAVMATAGATGTVSSTALASARHAMIVGSFKRAIP